MKKMLQRGFTLIELLVVIAIIGILAAVVLASLNDARSSGSDAAIKQGLGNLRSQAEIHYNKNDFKYWTSASVNSCSDAQSVSVLSGAVKAAGLTTTYAGISTAASSATIVVCHANAQAWAAAAPLPSSGSPATRGWCVDSTGFAGEIAVTALGTSDMTCQ